MDRPPLVRDELPARRAALLFGLPAVLLLATLVLPVVLGGETLILRDTLQVHMTLKAPQVQALQEGRFPLIDPLRMGGQPLAGNPNATPFYPDLLLFLVVPLFWAFNAHFWIHLLLAPVAGYWMGRAWGLSRPAAWAAGVCYGTSGYMLSQLNLYNLVAGAALAPAFVAAVLWTGRGRRPGAAAAAGLLWALLLLSGDPLSAVLAMALAGTAWLAVHGLRPRSAGWLLGGLAAGTLAALPQIVEFLQILPASGRAQGGAYLDTTSTVAAWHPVHALEWIVPTAFGRYDRVGPGGMWGLEFFEGDLPLFLSLYPGLLALALVLASGRPRTRPALWAWGAVGAGLFLALGGHNPVGAWLFDLPGMGLFRYPVKLWMLVGVGAALLCGIGLERTVAPALIGRAGAEEKEPVGEIESFDPRPHPGRLALALAVPTLLLIAIWLLLVLAPERFQGLVLAHATWGWNDLLAATERARWIALVVASLAVVAALGGALVLVRTRPALGACLLLAVHAAGQVYLLRPLATTDEVNAYREPPAALSAVPPDATVAHAGYLDLFGGSPLAAGRDSRSFWLLRQDHATLAPFAGVIHGIHYELNRSPEGLGTFLGKVAAGAIKGAEDDTVRVRALARWGVDAVVTDDPLRGVPTTLAEIVGRFPGVTKPVFVYRLRQPSPELLLAEQVLQVPHLNAAWLLFRSPGFDPERHVILPGPEDAPPPSLPQPGPLRDSGTVRAVVDEAERLEVEVASPVDAVLVVQRAHLPIWRATVDGEPVEIEPANIYRMGVRVPAGEHRVRLWVDRRSLVYSGIGSAVGVAGLLALAVVPVVRRRRAG